ncbi:MAG: 6-bladed beta-propeller [Candidatus Delongbacteria bacterium]|nr:6-bladed beta-propeller [Candidatus Delongbacteria bacterium]MBN2836709.1 6-bladed beta-propeller [Candidatus Delongbacteria bacterium]
MKILVLLAVLLLMFSCSKEQKDEAKNAATIEKIKNDGIRGEPEKIEFEELFTIGVDENEADTLKILKRPVDIDLDSKGRLFVLDVRDGNIKVYDVDGSWITTFGKQGNGPGEIARPQSMVIYNDTILIGDRMGRKVAMFDTDGNYLGDFKDFEEGVPDNFISLGKGRMGGFLNTRNRQEGKFGYNLAVMNSNFKVLQVLEKNSFSFEDFAKMTPQDFTVPFTADKNFIYVGENSETNYKINFFDFDGNKKGEITRSYRKLTLSDKDKEEYKISVSNMRRRHNEDETVVPKFKKSINSIYSDRNDYLFVLASTEEDFDGVNTPFDVYKDGKLIKKISLPLEVNNNFFDITERIVFKQDKVFKIDLKNQAVKAFRFSL